MTFPHTVHLSEKIDSLKPKLALIIFKYLVRNAKKTQHFTITKISWLTLFKKIIDFYTDNQTEPINTLCGQNAELLIVIAGFKRLNKESRGT
jgi:hypothetical protein